MQIYVDECPKEIGWLASATRNGREFYIDDCYLFDQEVNASTTEITPEGLSAFGEELLQRPNGIDTWNNIKVWGHSHVSMGVTPSGQDDSQMVTFSESGHDWFIRIIANKTKSLCVDVYDFDNGIIYKGVNWIGDITIEEQRIIKEINRLRNELVALGDGYFAAVKEPIVAEMKIKVRDKVYAPTYGYGVPDMTIPYLANNYAGYNYRNPDYEWDDDEKNIHKKNLKEETTTYIHPASDNSVTKVNSDDGVEDAILSMADVYKVFDDEILMEIGQCTNIYQAQYIVDMFDDYSDAEIKIIYETGQFHYKSSLR